MRSTASAAIANRLISGGRRQVVNQVADAPATLFKLKEEPEAGLLKGPDSMLIRIVGAEPDRRHTKRPESFYDQQQRFRTNAASHHLRLTDEDVHIHVIGWESFKTSHRSFRATQPLPLNVAD
jgi:hypothetical protein